MLLQKMRIPNMKREMINLAKSVAWAFAGVALSAQTALGSCDNFADAYEMPAGATSFTFSNAGYTKESGEPTHSSDDWNGGASGWAAWTAPATGEYTFWLEGSDDSSFDTQLAVYTGTSVGALTLVAANDDSPLGGYSSMLTFRAVAGTRYMIAMDSYSGASGTMTLSLERGYLRFNGYGFKSFAPSSGCTTEIVVESSANWNVVSSSDWVTLNTRSGSGGSKLSFTVGVNPTGAVRKGNVTLQSVGSTHQVTLSVWQHVLDYVTTKAAAESAAKSKNKRVLLIYGREECGNTRTTFFSSFTSENVKRLIESGYVVWYSNCDRQSDASGYGSGLSSWYLPLICIINPANMSTYVARETGYHDIGAMQEFLQASGGGTTIWTLKYHSNNGKNNLASQNFVQGKVQRLYYMDSQLGWAYKDEDGFNYVFLGWAKSPTGSVSYENGEQVRDLVAPGKVMHLYAVWQKRAYQVVFHSNDGANKTASQEFRPGIAKNLLWLDSGLKWTRSGYDFLGWAKSPTGGVVYANGAKVSDLAAMGETLHLYAVWKERRWFVCFHRNYGASATVSQPIAAGVRTKLYWVDSQLGWTRSGYWFKGWAKSPTADPVYGNGEAVKDLVGVGKTLHLYGAWGKKTSNQ